MFVQFWHSNIADSSHTSWTVFCQSCRCVRESPFFSPGHFKEISVTHGCCHQDSMTTFAHGKRRLGRGSGESISFAVPHLFHCFILSPGNKGFTSTMLLHTEVEVMKKIECMLHTLISKNAMWQGNELLPLWLSTPVLITDLESYTSSHHWEFTWLWLKTKIPNQMRLSCSFLILQWVKPFP